MLKKGEHSEGVPSELQILIDRDKKAKDFFESLANCKNSAAFEIWVTSNATRIPSWWTTVAAKFDKIRFHVSVDGTDETYQYIRGGHSYAGIKKNIEKFGTIYNTVKFSCSISGTINTIKNV